MRNGVQVQHRKLTNSDTLGVNGAKVGVFKQGDQVCFDRLLEGSDS